MQPRILLEASVRFGVFALALAALSYWFQSSLLDLLMPVYQQLVQWGLPGFHIDALDWRFERGERVVALSATLIEYRATLGRVIAPGLDVQVSTLAASAWSHPAIMFALALAWPQPAPWRRLTACLFMLPGVLLALAIDTPLMLVSSIEDYMFWIVNPDPASSSPGAGIRQFWAGGGRYVFALVLALCMLVLHRRFCTSHHYIGYKSVRPPFSIKGRKPPTGCV